MIADLVHSLPDSAKQALARDDTSLEIPSEMKLDSCQIESLRQKLSYYSDAIRFVKQINRAIPTIADLLASKTKTDVIEAIAFFVQAKVFHISNAEVWIDFPEIQLF